MISLDCGELKTSSFWMALFWFFYPNIWQKPPFEKVWTVGHLHPPSRPNLVPRAFSVGKWEWWCYCDTVTWASPRFGHLHSQNPLRFGLALQGMPISLGFWGRPKRDYTLITVTLPLPLPKGKSSGNEVGVARGIGGGAASFPGFSPTRPS